MSRLPITGQLGKFTWRMLATVLGSQALIILLGGLLARGTAMAKGADNGHTLLWASVALAVRGVGAAGRRRAPHGHPLGRGGQRRTRLSAVVVPAMIGVGLVFTGLWVLCLIKGQEIDAMVAARERDAEAAR